VKDSPEKYVDLNGNLPIDIPPYDPMPDPFGPPAWCGPIGPGDLDLVFQIPLWWYAHEKCKHLKGPAYTQFMGDVLGIPPTEPTSPGKEVPPRGRPRDPKPKTPPAPTPKCFPGSGIFFGVGRTIIMVPIYVIEMPDWLQCPGPRDRYL